MEKNQIQAHLATPEPWRQMDDEPNEWYERFIVYRDLGPTRTVSATIREITNKRNHTGRMKNEYDRAAAKYLWSDRAKSYDAYWENMVHHEREKYVREIVADQYEMVRVLTRKTLERIEQMEVDELHNAQDIIKAFDSAIKTGSLVIGLPTERTESSSVKFTINMNEKNLGDDKIIDI